MKTCEEMVENLLKRREQYVIAQINEITLIVRLMCYDVYFVFSVFHFTFLFSCKNRLSSIQCKHP